MYKLSVIVPVYNEIATLECLLKTVRMTSVDSLELIVVDDSSTDGTMERLKSDWASLADQVIFHRENRGKGAAVRSGFEVSSGSYVLVQDADLEYDPNEFGVLLEAIECGEVDVVYGSRFLHPDIKLISPLWHRTINGSLTMFSNFFTGLTLTDMETCYKLVPRELLNKINIEEERFGIEPELTAKLAAMGARIKEIPISYNRRNFDEGKKIGARDAFRALYVILKYGFKFV